MSSHVYSSLNRSISKDSLEKELEKIVLDEHKDLSLIEKIKENFSKEIWKSGYNYYIKYASTPNLD